jgi:hypothetical protein
MVVHAIRPSKTGIEEGRHLAYCVNNTAGVEFWPLRKSCGSESYQPRYSVYMLRTSRLVRGTLDAWIIWRDLQIMTDSLQTILKMEQVLLGWGAVFSTCIQLSVYGTHGP